MIPWVPGGDFFAPRGPRGPQESGANFEAIWGVNFFHMEKRDYKTLQDTTRHYTPRKFWWTWRMVHVRRGRPDVQLPDGLRPRALFKKAYRMDRKTWVVVFSTPST